MKMLSLAAGAVLALASTGPAFAQAQVSPELAQIIQGANKEGELKLIWSGSTLGGAAGAKQFEEGMKKLWGTTFTVKFAPGAGSMAEVGAAIMAELKAGRSAGTDIYLGPTTFVARFAESGMFQSAEWIKHLPGRITPEMVEANGMAVRFVSFVAGITYNTKLLPNPPTTVEGWLDPKLKGKLASTTAAAGLDVLAANDFWGEAKTLGFAQKLSANLGGLMRCGETNRIASGEFWALIFDCGGSDAFMAKAKGAPVDQVLAKDFVQARFFYLGVPKNAPNPNAAKTFLTFMMTPEGQKLAWETWAEDLHLFPESNIGKQINALQPRVLDIAWTSAHPETGDAREKILKVMRVADK